MCLNCGKSSETKFCSRSCSCSYNNRNRVRSEESRKKTSEAIKSLKNSYCKVTPCKMCGKFFSHTQAPSQAPLRCDVCKKIHKSECMRSLAESRGFGGHTSKKKIWYKTVSGEDIYLQSSYEVKLAEILDSLGVKWTRPDYLKWTDVQGKTHRYYPDFKVGDMYIDTKNDYLAVADKPKIDAVIEQNLVDVIILTIDKITAEYVGSLVQK